jgi:hypothetical protein
MGNIGMPAVGVKQFRKSEKKPMKTGLL